MPAKFKMKQILEDNEDGLNIYKYIKPYTILHEVMLRSYLGINRITKYLRSVTRKAVLLKNSWSECNRKLISLSKFISPTSFLSRFGLF